MDEFTEEQKSDIKRVKNIIRLKIFDYLEPRLKSYYNSMFLSGGCIASLIQNDKPKDWDVYFYDTKTQLAVIDMFVADYKDEIEVIDEKYRQVATQDGLCITENATTLKNGIQLITKHTGTPDVVRETFDFVHCKPYYDFGTDVLYISKEQYDLCKNKILKINNMKSQTTWRQSKFEQRGYKWP